MRMDVLQIEYGHLDQIAQRFKLLHEGISQINASIHSAYRPLEHADWRGQGSQAFFTTMATKLFPAFERLELALQAGQTTIMQVSQIIRLAEVEAAAVFQGDVQPITAMHSNSSGSRIATNGNNLQEEATTPTEGRKETPEEFIQRAAEFLQAVMSGGVVSKKMAQQIFDDMASQPHIPFNYQNDGCYARAQVMNDLIVAKYPTGSPRKVYAEGPFVIETKYRYGNKTVTKDETTIEYQGDDSFDGVVEWAYHTAPIISVRGSDGVPIDMVIDPSIADGPVTIDAWYTMMNPQNPPNPNEPPKYTIYDEHDAWYTPTDYGGDPANYSRDAAQVNATNLKICQDYGYCN